MIELTIVADYNDANYITEIHHIDQETLDKLHPIMTEVGKTRRYNWNTSEYAQAPSPNEMYPQFDEDVIDHFDSLVPYGEHGVHSIETIKIRVLEVLYESNYIK